MFTNGSYFSAARLATELEIPETEVREIAEQLRISVALTLDGIAYFAASDSQTIRDAV